MRNYLVLFLVLITALVSDLFAQDCALSVRGNTVGANGRFFIMTYADQAARDAANANISSITINGSTYNVGLHPTGNSSLRTTPVQSSGTFPVSFTGTLTLNPSGEQCEYTAGVLPVTLAYINAFVENSAVVIKWETLQEINNEGFEIQRSTDGRKFETFTWVDGAGSSNQTQNYKVRHADYSQGLNYYRLKQMDLDGAFEFSPTVTVNVEASNVARLEGNVIIQGQDVILVNAHKGDFRIFNSAGARVGSGAIEAQKQSISTTGFNPGMYLIRTQSGKILKFIIR